MSPDDDESHAIPKAQAAGAADNGTVDSECNKVLSVEKATHASNGRFCRTCLIKIGEGVPDHSWR